MKQEKYVKILHIKCKDYKEIDEIIELKKQNLKKNRHLIIL